MDYFSGTSGTFSLYLDEKPAKIRKNESLTVLYRDSLLERIFDRYIFEQITNESDLSLPLKLLEAAIRLAGKTLSCQ